MPVRILGLDVGSKTIGLAVSDELGMYAHPITTLQRHGTQKDAQKIATYCNQYNTKEVVIGLPLDLNGQETHRSQRVKILGDALQKMGLNVHYEDESFSTITAYEQLATAGMKKKKQQEVIDQQAAVVILSGWLEQRRNQ